MDKPDEEGCTEVPRDESVSSERTLELGEPRESRSKKRFEVRKLSPKHKKSYRGDNDESSNGNSEIPRVDFRGSGSESD